MRQFLARVAYWTSVGLDTSEFPVADLRERERAAKLKRRIGTAAFNAFRKRRHDPAFYASVAPIPIIGIIFLIMAIRIIQ